MVWCTRDHGNSCIVIFLLRWDGSYHAENPLRYWPQSSYNSLPIVCSGGASVFVIKICHFVCLFLHVPFKVCVCAMPLSPVVKTLCVFSMVIVVMALLLEFAFIAKLFAFLFFTLLWSFKK